MKTGFFLVVVMLGLTALADAPTVTDQFQRIQLPKVYQADQVMEQRLLVNKALTVDGGCVGCTTAVCSVDWDFPQLSEGGGFCSESASVSCAGASIRDSCTPGSNLGADGGATLLLEANLTCRAGTNAAVAKLCVHFTDGGTYNLHDAGFTLRTWR